MAPSVPTPSEVRQAFNEELHSGEQSALIGWLTFTGTFATVRIITYSIKDGKGPLGNITVGGVHIHHYLWGILGVSVAGGLAIRSDGRQRHPVLAAMYGSGLALIVDEFALLLDLKDVYWAKQGRVSVDLAIGMISSTGSVLVGRPILQRLRRNRLGKATPQPNGS